jgi:hypothetical protein
MLTWARLPLDDQEVERLRGGGIDDGGQRTEVRDQKSKRPTTESVLGRSVKGRCSTPKAFARRGGQAEQAFDEEIAGRIK